MEIEIGRKIQLARKEAGLTQEQAAEALSVSRQTVSNWENERSYPDIVSVIRMSDLYGVSLDVLLKGENQMSNTYISYLEDSTNVVKSNRNKGKAALISAYLLVWSFAMIVFWWLMDPGDAGGFSLIFLWGILPVLTFAASVTAGSAGYWGKWAWLAAPILGLGMMLAEFLTFETANHITFGNKNFPEPGLFLAGAAIAAAGMALGKGIAALKRKKTAKPD